MAKLVIERKSGGINPLKGRGEIDMAYLSPEARATIEAHFGRNAAAPPHGNEPVYRVTRHTGSGVESIDVPEHLMPAGLVGVVKDQLP